MATVRSFPWFKKMKSTAILFSIYNVKPKFDCTHARAHNSSPGSNSCFFLSQAKLMFCFIEKVCTSMPFNLLLHLICWLVPNVSAWLVSWFSRYLSIWEYAAALVVVCSSAAWHLILLLTLEFTCNNIGWMHIIKLSTQFNPITSTNNNWNPYVLSMCATDQTHNSNKLKSLKFYNGTMDEEEKKWMR